MLFRSWTRDGTNTPVWNRKNPATGSYYIMASKIGAKPGEEIQLTDKSYHAWVHSAVRDGRLLVAATPPKDFARFSILSMAILPRPARSHHGPW